MALGCVLAVLPRGTSQRGAWGDLGLRAPQNVLVSGSSSAGAGCDGHAAMPRSGEPGFGAPVRAGQLSPLSLGGTWSGGAPALCGWRPLQGCSHRPSPRLVLWGYL